MLEYFADLVKKSDEGDLIAQIELFFKLWYDWDERDHAMQMCEKLKDKHILFKAMLKLLKYGENIEKILIDIITSNESNAIRSYAHNMLFVKYYTTDECKIAADTDTGNEWACYNYGLHGAKDSRTRLEYYCNAYKKYNLHAMRELQHLPYCDMIDTNELQHQYDSFNNKKFKITTILMTGLIEWKQSNHQLWNNFRYEITERSIHTDKIKIHTICSFHKEILLLLLISKFRHLSKLPHIHSFYKNLVFSVAKQLAYIWAKS